MSKQPNRYLSSLQMRDVPSLMNDTASELDAVEAHFWNCCPTLEALDKPADWWDTDATAEHRQRRNRMVFKKIFLTSYEITRVEYTEPLGAYLEELVHTP
jgi:hypothetical protein